MHSNNKRVIIHNFMIYVGHILIKTIINWEGRSADILSEFNVGTNISLRILTNFVIARHRRAHSSGENSSYGKLHPKEH